MLWCLTFAEHLHPSDVTDLTGAKPIAEDPWSANKRPSQREIRKLLDNGFKMDVEAMISKDLEYLTEEYVPMKLKDRKQWLD